MRDLFFFPLAAVVIAGIIYFALNAGDEIETLTEADILREGYVMTGADFDSLTASPGTNFILPSTEAGGTNYAIFSAQAPQDGRASIGIFATLGPEFESAFAGRKIEITINARRGQERPSDMFLIGYYTLNAGASGWQTFSLSDNFQDHSFTFTPGRPEGMSEIDYLGIWPAPEGENKTMEVNRITIKAVNL